MKPPKEREEVKEPVRRRNLSIETGAGYLTTRAKIGFRKNFFKEEVEEEEEVVPVRKPEELKHAIKMERDYGERCF